MQQATEWIWVHQHAIIAAVTTLLVLLRLVPAAWWSVLEKDWPRAANLARLLRAIFPDVVKAAKALWAIFTGRPWPFAILEPIVTAPRKP